MGNHRKLTQDELYAEARQRFGPDPRDWAFRCPNCGDVATARDFPEGMGERIGQECVGRHLGALERPARDGVRGCDWVAYGLIRGPWIVTMPDSSEIGSFPLADAPVATAKTALAELRALTIHQPWAAAIAYGTKRVENRSWPAPQWIIGQAIAIHAGKQADLGARPPVGESWPEHRMHLGAIIAVAKVTGCHHATGCPSSEPGAPWPLCSPWAVRDQFHWVLDDVRPLAEPAPCRGAQGLWRANPALLAAVQAQLVKAAADA